MSDVEQFRFRSSWERDLWREAVLSMVRLPMSPGAAATFADELLKGARDRGIESGSGEPLVHRSNLDSGASSQLWSWQQEVEKLKRRWSNPDLVPQCCGAAVGAGQQCQRTDNLTGIWINGAAAGCAHQVIVLLCPDHFVAAIPPSERIPRGDRKS